MVVKFHTHVDSCNYHHKNDPSWICSGCNLHLCEQCVPFGHSPHWGRSGPRCPLCNKALIYHTKPVEAEPFWSLLPQFFAYPLHIDSLKVIGVVSLAGLLLLFFPLLSLLIGLLLLAVTVKYSFQIIEERAMNMTEPPSISDILNRDNHHLFFKLVVVMIILYGGAFFASWHNPMLFNVLNGVITFVLPAVTIILAIEKSIMTTLNPFIVLSFILRIGWAYLLIWFCYHVVSSGPTVVYYLLPEETSYFLSVPLVIAVSLYFWFVANCMLGYAVFQYQDSLGHSGSIEARDADISKELFDKKRALADAYIATREGDTERARNMLRPLLDQYKYDEELHQQYHKILMVTDDNDALKNHADYFIRFLIDQGKGRAATVVYDDTTSKIAQYKPQSVHDAYEMAKIFYANGKKKGVVKLLNNIHKLNASDTALPAAYFLLAKIYSEHLSDDKQAMKLVDFLLNNFPKTDIRRELIQFKKLLSS